MSVQISKATEAQNREKLVDFLMNLDDEKIEIIFRHLPELIESIQK